MKEKIVDRILKLFEVKSLVTVGLTVCMALLLFGPYDPPAEALGLFVDTDGNLYVADKKAPAVYVADPQGRVTGTVGAPPADKVEEGFEYTPSKVVVDSAGILYILSANTYSGALQYGSDYQFIGFYGSERVEGTFDLLVQRIWKKLLSEKAASGQ